MTLAALALAWPGAAYTQTVDYPVARGDTLTSIAQRYLLKGVGWRPLQKLNRIAAPRKLRAGSTIKVPIRWLRRDPQNAQLAAFHGSVKVAVMNQDRVPKVGMALPEQTLIGTNSQSFASLALPDGSVLAVHPATTVRIAELGRVRMTGGLVRNFDVQTGTVRSVVTPARTRDDTFIIRTPLANSSVRGTEFRVVSDPDERGSRIEVIKGIVEINGGTMVTAGYGTKVDSRGVGTLQSLPPAPELLRPGRIQDQENLIFSFKSQQGVERWHLLVSRDAGFIEPLVEASARGAEVEMDPLPDGTYFLRATAIDQNGLEGVPRDYTFRRERYSFGAAYSEMRGNGARPTYLFRWQAPPAGQGRFRFVLRSVDSRLPALIDELGVDAAEIVLRDLPAGSYRWKVGRWSEEEGRPILIWDDEHELNIAN